MEFVETNFCLGSKVRDTVTGLVGIITGRVEWLNGCKRYAVQPPVDKDGKVPKVEWVDVQQAEVVEAAKRAAAKPSGGPMPSPQRSADPRW